MFCQATDRGYSRHDYLGIYTQKSVQLLGKIVATYDSEADEHGQMQIKLFDGEDRPEFRQRISRMAVETKEQVGWDLESGTRFFCADKFLPTEDGQGSGPRPEL